MLSAYFYSVLVTILISVLIIIIFRKLDIVDKPDGIRKIHKGEISYGGGIVLFFSFSIILYLGFPEFSLGVYGENPALSVIWFVSSIILFLGLIDDIKPIQPSIRIIIQVVASWLVIALTDVYLKDLGNLFDLGLIELGGLGIPVTIFMVVGMCNAFNMLDGMDGLVSFSLLIPSTFIAVLAYMNNSYGLIFIASIVLLIFLLFNLGLFGKKWKIFLGDSGSLWLGFLTAWFLVCFAENESNFSIYPVTALWFVLIPLVDALSTFLNRMVNRRSIFDGDRSHLHFILLDAGLKKWQVLCIFILINIFCSGLGFYFLQNNTPEYYQFYGFLTIWLFYHLLIKLPMTNEKKV